MSRVGKFLIARPTVTSDFFANTVVFVYEENHRGTAGIALTHPVEITFANLAQERGFRPVPEPAAVYRGGPVSRSAVMMLHSDEFTASNTLHTGTGLDVSSDEIMIEKIASGCAPVYYRLTVGASVWAPGQLDREIARGLWLVADLDPEIVFGTSGHQQWEAAIESVASQTIARYF
jgi:putative transcriptional regulator